MRAVGGVFEAETALDAVQVRPHDTRFFIR